eukprot:CAMPEP_0168429840 /NCGR_PEP_ID=MMETSP0228-20121227/37576_1 /TAXON_ID=133427 /ORGANISM="Protoceratium reticulatum, Strain CCCM 535 (=CCMP 1889)" /LENGTH=263 /DNA_ID=CAMNT_0008443935 /DNA_START=50 /DNA_END=841 /DNA_ORIENTATION=+
MTESRWSNAFGDIVLTVQLISFFCDWLQRRPKTSFWGHRAAFCMYALNLLLATVFTGSGCVMHIVDPLPQRATGLWLVFLLSCVSTPILFPAICACALRPQMSALLRALCMAWVLLSAGCHATLALAGLALPLVELLGQPLDGRSIGGEPYGVAFDMLSSIPNLRGDAMFPHAGLFTASALGALLLCMAGARGCQGAELGHRWRLALSVGIMFLGQVVMIPLMILIGVPRTLDLWHVSMFVVMALAYTSLKAMVTAPVDRKAQ